MALAASRLIGASESLIRCIREASADGSWANEPGSEGVGADCSAGLSIWVFCPLLGGRSNGDWTAVQPAIAPTFMAGGGATPRQIGNWGNRCRQGKKGPGGKHNPPSPQLEEG